MEVLIREKSYPGRQYIFINVKEIYVGKLYNANGKCINHYYKLVDMSGELHDECWDVTRYVIYKKFEFNEVDDSVSEVND